VAKLAGRVALIKGGAATEVELNEKQRRVDGALVATRAAVEEGIVPGGGIALVHAERTLDDHGLEDDYAVGARVVRSALSEPMHWIVENAGCPHAALIAVHMREGNQSEALREFERYRARLGAAFGLEPTGRLRALLPR
jgi:chaperonin GroEL